MKFSVFTPHIEPPVWPVYSRLMAAICLGLAWGSGPDWLMASAVLMPAVVLHTRSRQGALVLSALYFALAARALPGAASTFFGSDWVAVVTALSLYVGAVALNAVVWAFAWAKRPKILRALLALAVTSLPPVGLVGWAHPLAASGWLFPGLGLGGAALAVALAATFFMKRKRWALVLASGSLALNAIAAISPVATPVVFEGVPTTLGDAAKAPALAADAVEAAVAKAQPGAVVLLPESTMGRLEPVKFEFLTGLQAKVKAADQIALIGAEASDETRPSGFKNGLVVVGEETPRFIAQRVPVPASMWRPFSSKGAAADLFGTGITTIKGLKSASLICYEQIITFPALISSAHSPKVILAPSSVWWASKTSIPEIQRASARSWARLNRATLVLSINS